MNTVFTALAKKAFHEMATPEDMLKFAEPNVRCIFKVISSRCSKKIDLNVKNRMKSGDMCLQSQSPLN